MRAKSCTDLRTILDKNEDSIVCSLIHKYGHNAGKQADIDQYRKELLANLPHGYKAKGNIIAFIDECHRTNSGKLHEAVRTLMPDAVLIGFTGTPLLKTDKKRASLPSAPISTLTNLTKAWRMASSSIFTTRHETLTKT